MKRVTIKDVAKEAGVSITTVSHSLSGGGVVKKESRERILRIAQEMNYIPDWSGSSLKGAKTSIIGCDNIELVQWYQPTFNSVDTGIARQGIEAIRELIRLINDNTDGRVIKLPGQIIKRGSCQKAAR